LPTFDEVWRSFHCTENIADERYILDFLHSFELGEDCEVENNMNPKKLKRYDHVTAADIR